MRKNEKQRYYVTIAVILFSLIFMVTCNFVAFYRNAVSNMVTIGERSLAQETQQLSAYLDKGIDVLQVTKITVEYMLQNGAGEEEIKAFLTEEAKRYEQDIDKNFTGIYGLFQGTYIDGIGWQPGADFVPKEREWYTAAYQAGGSPVIVSPYVDAQTNTVMISVSQLLYDGESVISLDIVLDEIQAITGNIRLGQMGYGFIMDHTGLVVAHSDESQKGLMYTQQLDMRELAEKILQRGNATFTAKVSGKECTIFTNTVRDDWHVVMIIGNTQLYHTIRMLLLQNIALCIVMFAIVVYFCTRAFRKMKKHMLLAQESQRKAENMSETLMKTLAHTIDAKDRYTNGHSLRVARYSMEIAKKMGKSEQEQKEIYDAAILHDVGKISIPDAIINKSSRLTDEEYARIKLHTTSGYYILRDIKENKSISEGAKWHHERYDGFGYPNGLKGENIPEIARIIGVADAYDAMTSNRSYRAIMPQETVRKEIENGKGKQFDPQIADVMLALMDEDKDYQMKQAASKGFHILAVDDEEMNLAQMAFVLKDEPRYHLYKKTSGKEALKDFADIAPDLVILDIQMPQMNGFEVYEKIREISDVPVIFLTADKSLETIERARAVGVNDYLAKPFMPQALLEILHNMLREE